MGLTIHYTVKFKGTAQQLQDKLGIIRNKCLDLPFEEVGEVICTEITQKHINTFNFLQQKYSYPNNTEENLEIRNQIMQEMGVTISQIINLGVFHKQEPSIILDLNLWPGEGCESCNLTFFKTKNQRIFRCGAFCKTQYAVNFVRCHLLVIKLMDLLKEEGFSVEVSDEGEYWETRDLSVLGKNINDYTDMISSIFGQLKSITKDNGMEVKSPITESKNYIRVK